jgi:DNA mismatch repair ATPase MutS
MKKLDEVEKIVSKYASLIAIAEQMEWSAKSDKLSSKAFKDLLSVIHTFNNRNNPIAGLIFNVFAAYDLQAHYKLQQWKTKHADKMVSNILAIYRLDMLLSLSNVRANHPEFNYANFTDGYFEAENLYHPLLDSKVAVKNNVELTSKGQMLIVTGPNMAGKSTLQRSVGVAVILANMGCPLPADRLTLRKFDLYTSMRASDDLSENESYFFSELKRLKFILDGARKETSCMVLLDEILRGTNSKDKAEGSAKYIQKLSATKAFGLVATHDLSLTKMANEIPKFENWYFDAKIEGAEIHFDYKLRPGVCQNMNATFLMKNMDLV